MGVTGVSQPRRTICLVALGTYVRKLTSRLRVVTVPSVRTCPVTVSRGARERIIAPPLLVPTEAGAQPHNLAHPVGQGAGETSSAVASNSSHEIQSASVICLHRVGSVCCGPRALPLRTAVASSGIRSCVELHLHAGAALLLAIDELLAPPTAMAPLSYSL
jgi:hypothetical protein